MEAKLSSRNYQDTVHVYQMVQAFLVHIHIDKKKNVFHFTRCNFEPAHEIMALFVLLKFPLQTSMRSHPVGLDVWFLVGPFVYFHTSCVRRCASSSEPSLVAYISTISHELAHFRSCWYFTYYRPSSCIVLNGPLYDKSHKTMSRSHNIGFFVCVFFFFFNSSTFWLVSLNLIWATSWENLFKSYANNKSAAQPAHLRRLISAFVICCLGSIIALGSLMMWLI